MRAAQPEPWTMRVRQAAPERWQAQVYVPAEYPDEAGYWGAPPYAWHYPTRQAAVDAASAYRDRTRELRRQAGVEWEVL